MIVCGVDIKSKEAIVAVLQGSSEANAPVDCESRKFTLGDDRDATSLFTLLAAIEAFARHHKVEAFVVKTRQATGRAAASGLTFKIEALFQLSKTPVEFISPPTLAKFAKSSEPIPTTMFAYQADAYHAAAWRLSKE